MRETVLHFALGLVVFGVAAYVLHAIGAVSAPLFFGELDPGIHPAGLAFIRTIAGFLTLFTVAFVGGCVILGSHSLGKWVMGMMEEYAEKQSRKH